MVYIIVYILAWILGIIIYGLNPDIDFVTAFLLSNLVFGIGVFGLINFVGHTFFSEKIARTIGWTSNGFQKELGFVSFGIGLCGVLCFWFRDGFWIATAIPFSVFLVGAGCMHVVEIIKNSPCIADPEIFLIRLLTGSVC